MTYERLAEKVYLTYLRCAVQRSAVQTVVDSVLNSDLFLTASSISSMEPVADSDKMEWTIIITRVVTELLVFGYCACTVIKGDTINVMVAPGYNIVPVLDKKTNRFKYTGLDPKRKWHIIELFRPIELPSGELIMDTGAAKAMDESHYYKELMDNLIHRDRFNTRPSVYVEKIPIAGMDFFKESGAQQLSIFGDVAAQPDIPSWALRQSELMHHLHELSAKAQKETEKQYAESLERAKAVGKEESVLMQIPIGEGTKAHELAPRQNPPEFDTLVTSSVNRIFLAYDVPPQSKGMKQSSERQSSADRQIQTVLANYDAFITRIVTVVEIGLRPVSAEVVGTNKIRLHIRRKPSAFNLSHISPMLKTDKYITLLSSLHSIPEEWWDKESVRLEQMGHLEQDENRVANSHDVDGGGAAVPPSKVAKKDAHDLKHQT